MQPGAYGIPNPQPGGLPFVRQSAVYWSAGSGVSTTPFTMTAAPLGTMLAVFSADNGSHFGNAYSVTHTGYAWSPLLPWCVDSTNYPPVSAWIGTPLTPGIGGGTSVTFLHNGANGYRAGIIYELTRRISGEVLTPYSRHAWTIAATTLGASGVLPISTVAVPRERGLVTLAWGAMQSGGAGPNIPAPSGLAYRVGLASGLLAAVVGQPVPGVPYSLSTWFSSSRSTRWSGGLVILR